MINFRTIFSLIFIFTTVIVGSAFAAEKPETKSCRWTFAEDQDANLPHVLQIIKVKTGIELKESDLALQDDRDLAFNHYSRYEQLIAGLPVAGASVRIWKELNSNKTIQVEAALQDQSLMPTQKSFKVLLSSDQTNLLARNFVKNSDDSAIRSLDWKDQISGTEVVRLVTVKGKRGKHLISISHRTGKVVSSEYHEFPQDDPEALVYPIYEETDKNPGVVLDRVKVTLKNISPQIQKVSGDIYASLRAKRYFENRMSSILGETESGRALGYWSMGYIKKQAATIRSLLPFTENNFYNGLLLQGKYATINIHPDAITHFTNLNFTPKAAAPFFPNWIGSDPDEMVPGSAFTGKPIFSAEEILLRPARRLPDHDPAQYINDGFDEIQVYYAINQLMESLQAYGFQDPDFSTRKFDAFLFNPDIAYRDNAFYTDDTINFTTYSANENNAARNNTTIWHELGHGIMDRLMGDNLTPADTGGLSEGMADFIAALVVQDVTKGNTFPGADERRIINRTGFNLTNEVHDDGEAYGGAMKDFLDAALIADPMNGLHKVTDVVLEGMRLSRDHPALTAAKWFQSILFADSMGRRGVRAAGEMKPFLESALASRNFKFDGTPAAIYSLKNEVNNQEIIAGSLGSRSVPVKLLMKKDETKDFKIAVSLKSTPEYQFVYPVTVKAQFNGGPLQGAVHWVGEENGSLNVTLNSEAEIAHLPLSVSGACDSINREDGSCVDFVYVQILSKGQKNPSAKKRFYVRIKNP